MEDREPITLTWNQRFLLLFLIIVTALASTLAFTALLSVFIEQETVQQQQTVNITLENESLNYGIISISPNEEKQYVYINRESFNYDNLTVYKNGNETQSFGLWRVSTAFFFYEQVNTTDTLTLQLDGKVNETIQLNKTVD